MENKKTIRTSRGGRGGSKLTRIMKTMSELMEEINNPTPTKEDAIIFMNCQGKESKWKEVLDDLRPFDYKHVYVIVQDFPPNHPTFHNYWIRKKTGRPPKVNRIITKSEIINEEVVPSQKLHGNPTEIWDYYFKESVKYTGDGYGIEVCNPNKSLEFNPINGHLQKWLNDWGTLHQSKTWWCFHERFTTISPKPQVFLQVMREKSKGELRKIEEYIDMECNGICQTIAGGWFKKLLTKHKSTYGSSELIGFNVVVIPNEQRTKNTPEQASKRIQISNLS